MNKSYLKRWETSDNECGRSRGTKVLSKSLKSERLSGKHGEMTGSQQKCSKIIDIGSESWKKSMVLTVKWED